MSNLSKVSCMVWSGCHWRSHTCKHLHSDWLTPSAPAQCLRSKLHVGMVNKETEEGSAGGGADVRQCRWKKLERLTAFGLVVRPRLSWLKSSFSSHDSLLSPLDDAETLSSLTCPLITCTGSRLIFTIEYVWTRAPRDCCVPGEDKLLSQ